MLHSLLSIAAHQFRCGFRDIYFGVYYASEKLLVSWSLFIFDQSIDDIIVVANYSPSKLVWYLDLILAWEAFGTKHGYS